MIWEFPETEKSLVEMKALVTRKNELEEYEAESCF